MASISDSWPEQTHNQGRVEHMVAMLFGRVQSMISLARLAGASKDLHRGLRAKCASTTAKMENAAMKGEKEFPFCQFYRKDSPLLILSKHLEKFASSMTPKRSKAQN